MNRRISLATLVFLLLFAAISPMLTARELGETSIIECEEFENVKAELESDSGELTISKWDDEVFFKISTFDTPILHKVEDSKEILEYQSYTARVYEIAEGMEYEIIFESRPLSTVIKFKLESEGLNFYYQPPLSDETFPKGWFVNETHAIDEKGTLRNYRPINIVGSYAVYHATKKNNQYGNGKVGSIDRPLVYDANGSEIYGEMKIEGSTLSIIIPEIWLDNAVYPVTVDPTFGYTTVGGSTWNVLIPNYLYLSNSSLLENNVNITQLSIYGYSDAPGSKSNVTMIVYDHDGEPNNLVISSLDTGYINITDVVQWWNYTVSGGYTASAGIYWIGAWTANVDDHLILYYDDPAGNVRTGWEYDFPPFSNPFNDPFEGSSTRLLSIFATYTAPPAEYYLDAENLTLSTLLVGENITVSMDLETNSTPAFYWFGHNSSGEWENTTAKAWTVNGSVSGWFWNSPQIGYPFGVIGYANTTDNFNSTSGFFLTVSDTVTLITEEIWIALIIFMFLVVIGYLKKDAILHLIAVVVGIALMITFFSSDPYMGFIMAIISIYLAWYALWVEWDQKE